MRIPRGGFRGGAIAGTMAGVNSEEVEATMEVGSPGIRPCLHKGPGKPEQAKSLLPDEANYSCSWLPG